MTDHVQYLKKKINTVTETIMALPLYQELTFLNKLLGEAEKEKGITSTKQQPDLFTAERIAPLIHRKTTVTIPKKTYWPDEFETEKSGWKRDTKNTPAPRIKNGKRIQAIYEATEKVVRADGGEMRIPDIEEALKKQGFNCQLPDVKGRIRSVLATYIYQYNKRNPENQTLSLWPTKTCAQTRVSQYLKVFYTGSQRLSA